MFDRKNNGKTRDPGKYDTKIFDHKRSFSSLLFSFYSSPNIVITMITKKWFLLFNFFTIKLSELVGSEIFRDLKNLFFKT